MLLPSGAQTPPLDPLKTSITIVEKITAETPASITVIETPQIRQVPGVNLDDRLRMVPGFQLFRRSSSLVAHPTTQGVSLRGLGTTGASRTLVLWDGVPVNAPFGGWVYWSRVAPEELARVELSRGASTSVFGDRAMSGAIALFSRPAQARHLDAGYEGGNRNTHILSAGYSHLWKRMALSGHGRAFTTDGYFIVPESVRGPADQQAGVRFVAGDARWDLLGASDRLFLKIDLLAEDRANGTVLQRNSTSLGNIAAHYVRETSANGYSLLAYHTREEFRSIFSTIAADRRSERLAYLQTVPSEAVGAAGLWRHTHSRWTSLVGGDLHRVEGVNIETVFPTGRRVGGGTILQHGLFAQWDARAGPTRWFLGARHHFTGQDRQFLSPSAGFTAGRGLWRTRASVYRSFRAPTLNELHRDFIAGNAVTRANPDLRPERVFGAEVGLDLHGETTRAGVSLFRSSLRDLVTNVTLSSTPSQIVRQRRNAARALARGVEFDLRHRRRRWQSEFSYLYADSRYSTGLRTPQVPRHQASAQFSLLLEGTLASVGFRSYSAQFEDDLNRFLLPGFPSFHLAVRRRLRTGLFAVLSFENLFNREYLVGFSPTPAIGPPRLWRAGLRWEGRL